MHFITGNPGKFAEGKAVIPSLEQIDLDLVEIQEIDARQVIDHKLREASRKRGGTLIVEDTSLHIDALGGLPGPLVKWFLNTIGCLGIYNLVGETSARAVCMLGLLSSGSIAFFEGKVEGHIVSPAGGGGFGFDSIFRPDGEARTFAEMSLDEKRTFSMRESAFLKLRDFLEDDSDMDHCQRQLRIPPDVAQCGDSGHCTGGGSTQ